MPPSETTPTICTKCKHMGKVDENFRIWTCSIGSEMRRNYVTGNYDPILVYCQAKNPDGKCPDYWEADSD